MASTRASGSRAAGRVGALRRPLLPLWLGVKRGVFRKDDPHASAADAKFGEIRETILGRDARRCRYCGFIANRYQEIHHVNGDHDDNTPDNLVCACPFCHGTQHVGFQGVSGKAKLVALPPPYVPLAQFCDFQRHIFLAALMRRTAAEGDTAQSILDMIESEGRARCIRMLGHDDPAVLGDYLLSLNNEDYEHARRRAVNVGIRLLFDCQSYHPVLRSWARLKSFIEAEPMVSAERQLTKLAADKRVGLTELLKVMERQSVTAARGGA